MTKSKPGMHSGSDCPATEKALFTNRMDKAINPQGGWKLITGGPIFLPMSTDLQPNDGLAQGVVSALPHNGQEHVWAGAFDAHGKPLAWTIVASGTVDMVPLFPRDILAWAITVPLCRYIGVAHNHPSGDVTPSGPDGTGTANLAKVAAALGLDCVWSLVVTHASEEWAEIPLGGKKPQPGEREPYQPQEPEAEPEGEPEEQKEPEGEPEAEPQEEPAEPTGRQEPDPDETQHAAPPEVKTPDASLDDIRNAVAKAFGIKH